MRFNYHSLQWSKNTDLVVTAIIIGIAMTYIWGFSNVYWAAPNDTDKFKHFSPRNTLPSAGDHWGCLCNKHDHMPTLSEFSLSETETLSYYHSDLPPCLCFSQDSRMSDQAPLHSSSARPLTVGSNEDKKAGLMAESKKKTLILLMQSLSDSNATQHIFICMHLLIYLSIICHLLGYIRHSKVKKRLFFSLPHF